jgi:cellulose synthase/poly-beta-1,6-N-acetylglucosamine synthase-like glycosyltransferase
MFQRVEYHYNNLLRRSFSLLFSTGIWFFGAFACYRKDVLKEVGYFQKDSLTEDMAIELQIYEKGYRTENVSDAIGYTLTPSSLIGLFKQRSRWWTGATQALFKHKKLFSFKSDLSIIFLFINQCWWTIFALLSTPLIFYQVNYWLSSNVDTFYHLFMYLFRWFSLLGPFYVLYKIPVWGVSLYSIFGVTTGIITTIIVVLALVLFKDRITWRSLIAMFFYFPYTIILNLIVILSIFRLIFLKKRHFIA